VSLSHRPRSPRPSFFEDRRLSAPRSDGPPAPLRLEQPSPRTSPISDAPLSPLGHHLAGSRTDGQLARRPSCDERLALTRATETVTLPHLAELQERRSGRLPPCRNRPGLPPAAEPHLPPGLEASCNPRTVLASRPPPCASARRSESPLASAASSIRLAAPRASRRAMRRTSFCHLTSSYEHPYLAGSRVVERLRARHRRSRLLHGRTSRFGGSHVAPLRDFTASGVVFPSRCVRTGPLTPLSPPARSPWSSRSLRSRTGRRDRPSPPA